MTNSAKSVPIDSTWLWHVPAVLVLVIYVPASLFGVYILRDAYAFSFLALVAIFAGSYYALYPHFAHVFLRVSLRSYFWRVGDRVNWRACAWIAVAIYIMTVTVATLTSQTTPLGAALRGASWMDIADARAGFLAKREGAEVLLRYSAVILGRSVMPFLVTYLYWSGHRLRHVALSALLLCFGISLEKASPIFVFLPLILLRTAQKRWKAARALVVFLLACVTLWTFLATGRLHKPGRTSSQASAAVASTQTLVVPLGIEEHRRRHWVFAMIQEVTGRRVPFDETTFSSQLLWVANRMAWIPYITAYDWLRFQEDVLGGRLTLGRSIGVVSWFMGEPRLRLEQMVYAYQFGESPGGAGASNTVFFVDAKLAFGWLGVMASCLLFPLFAAAVFSSANDVAKIASVTSFFTASVSPLTATLLSGGLSFYLVISLLTRLERGASSVETGAH